jgi:hypothetical protein
MKVAAPIALLAGIAAIALAFVFGIVLNFGFSWCAVSIVWWLYEVASGTDADSAWFWPAVAALTVAFMIANSRSRSGKSA